MLGPVADTAGQITSVSGNGDEYRAALIPDRSLARRARRAARYYGQIIHFIWTHPANEGAQARALLRAGSYQFQARVLGRRMLARLGDRSRIWADLRRTAAWKAVYANPPDYPEMLVWQQVLGPGDLFVDVGANIGCYAVLAAELGAEVIAVEPAADTFALLRENIALNGYEIRAVQAAAGARAGTARFTSGLDCANQFSPAGQAETALVTVDSLLGGRAAAGMKIDVEGFELEVLRGCAQALAAHRIALIQLEWNATSQAALGTDRTPVADLLEGHGYLLCRPDAQGHLVPLTETGFGADVFAVPHGGPAGC
jgi:FkbM family methyltransferase